MGSDVFVSTAKFKISVVAGDDAVLFAGMSCPPVWAVLLRLRWTAVLVAGSESESSCFAAAIRARISLTCSDSFLVVSSKSWPFCTSMSADSFESEAGPGGFFFCFFDAVSLTGFSEPVTVPAAFEVPTRSLATLRGALCSLFSSSITASEIALKS